MPISSRALKIGGGVAAAWLVIAIPFVSREEGTRLTPYYDSVGVLTVCTGETKGVKKTDKYTPEQCAEMLRERLVEFNEGVDKCVKVEMPDTRRAAMVSLAYNIGTGAFCKSSVVRKLNAGDTQGACDAMRLYNRAGPFVLQGLKNRRERERKLCLQAA